MFYLSPYGKINSKLIRDLILRPETMKLLEDNEGEILKDIGVWDDLWDNKLTTQIIKSKLSNVGDIKLRNF